MPRIRTLKPEFWTDEKMSLLDPVARLVFLGLISMADDAGRLVDNVKLLDGQLFPSTDDSCRDSLDTLARMGRIIRYQSESGQALIQVANWDRHQKVDKPSKYTLPGPDTAVATASRDSRDTPANVSRSDLLPTTNDLRPPTRAGGGAKRDTAEALEMLDKIQSLVEEQPTPQSGTKRFIRQAKVREALGDEAAQAFHQIGGSKRLLNSKPELIGVLARDMADMLARRRSA